MPRKPAGQVQNEDPQGNLETVQDDRVAILRTKIGKGHLRRRPRLAPSFCLSACCR